MEKMNNAGAFFLNLDLRPGKERSMTRMVSSDFGRMMICYKSIQALESSWHSIRKEAESLGMWK